MSQESPLTIWIVGGLVASGKSTVARVLATRTGSVHLEADALRHELLEKEVEEKAPSAPHHSPDAQLELRWARDLDANFANDLYRELLSRAECHLAAGRSVVLDACFPHKRWREEALQMANGAGAHFRFVECWVPPAVAAERLRARDRSAGRTGWSDLHRSVVEHYEDAGELSADERIRVRTDRGIEEAVAEIDPSLANSGQTRLDAMTELPTAFTFDCWNTLLVEEDWPHAHARRVDALARALARAGLRRSRAEASAAFDTAWERHQGEWRRGVSTGAAEIATWSFAYLGAEASPSSLRSLVRDFEEASHTSHVVAVEGSRELLGLLAEAGIPCALVCDTGLTPGRRVRQLLERVGLLQALSSCAFSDEVGAPKPHPQVFECALEALGVPARGAAHVGDLRRTDVAGAAALGMTTIRYSGRMDDRCELREADFVVGHHEELRTTLAHLLAQSHP